MTFSSSVTANRIAYMATIRGLAPVLIVPEVLETLEHYRNKLGFETRELSLIHI